MDNIRRISFSQGFVSSYYFLLFLVIVGHMLSFRFTLSEPFLVQW